MANETRFKGTGTALVTPFRHDGTLDERALHGLIQRQIQAGIDFLVPCGTTGESPTLTHEEHLRVVEIAVKLGKGKVPVLAGAGGYNTMEVISRARELAEIGADGILSVTPYYNKPTQEGLYQHFRTIAEAREIHRRYHPLMEINFVESNPIPVKAALAEMELLEPVWRLPLVPPKAENRARIRGVLESLGLVAREGASYARERYHAALAH